MARSLPVRVSPRDVTPERLDTGYYSAEYFSARKAIVESGISSPLIGDVAVPWCFGAYALCNEIRWAASDNGVPYLKAESLGTPLLNEDALSYVTPETHRLLDKSRLMRGDIIVSTSGTVGLCAVIPEHIPEANSNQDTIKFRLPTQDYDSYFVAAWLSCRIAQAIMRREAGGAIQNHIYLYNFKRLPLLNPSRIAQRYIGDKVRQAERFKRIASQLSTYAIRAVDAYMASIDRARELEEATRESSAWKPIPNSILSPNPVNCKTKVEQPFSRVSCETLTPRLDCSFYAPEAIEVDRRLSSGYTTAMLHEIVEPTRLITNGVRGPDLQPSSFKLVRLQDREGWSIDFDRCLSISDSQFRENRRCELRERDVVVAIGGYIGHAAIVRRVQPAVIGQHSAVLPMGENSQVDEGFLVAYLSSRIGAILLQRYVSGTVQAGINLEDLREVRIAVPSREFQKHVGDAVRRADDLSHLSTRLRVAAGRLVEALVEGKLSEAELVATQRAVDARDEGLDREILLRLCADGIDVAGKPPLFPDIDALYAAIDQSEKNPSSNGDTA
jgi:type I restriction enzyme, S subunit